MRLVTRLGSNEPLENPSIGELGCFTYWGVREREMKSANQLRYLKVKVSGYEDNEIGIGARVSSSRGGGSMRRNNTELIEQPDFILGRT